MCVYMYCTYAHIIGVNLQYNAVYSAVYLCTYVRTYIYFVDMYVCNIGSVGDDTVGCTIPTACSRVEAPWAPNHSLKNVQFIGLSVSITIAKVDSQV